jgi:hypothetical protein
MLDVVFANFADLKFVLADSGLVTPGTYHPPLSIDVFWPHVNNINLNCEFSYQIFASGNYTLLYSILSTYDCSSVYETSSVDAVVTSLNAAVRRAMEQANSLPGSPIHEGKKNYFLRRFKNKPSEYFYDRFSYYRKLVKNTIKSNRLTWLKSVDNNLKSRPQNFWKYVSNFNNTSGSI